MASEVAPCMPLQIFRRATSGRRLRPQEICRRLTEDLNALRIPEGSQDAPSVGGRDAISSGGSAIVDPLQREQIRRTVSEDVQKQLQQVLEVLEDAGGGAGGAPAGDHPHESAGELLAQFLAADLPARLVANLPELEFEVRKEVIGVFSAIVRLGSQLHADQQIQEYARSHPAFFQLLLDGYGKPEVATHCGMMLRSCARHPQLVRAFMEQPETAIRLLSFTQHKNFDISSDAFSTLHDFMLTHKAESAKFLEANFRNFFQVYNMLLQSEDYVTQRQALKLLSEMLLDRTFMRVMLAYIGDETFLQIHMNLLRADSKAIQFEAFHVFKIFVANPQKPPRVQHILYKNKEKLIKLLETLRGSRPDDRQFTEDKSTVIGKLQVLEPPPAKAPPTGPVSPVASSGTAGIAVAGSGASGGVTGALPDNELRGPLEAPLPADGGVQSASEVFSKAKPRQEVATAGGDRSTA